jgi:hypothetical protein
MKIYKLITIIIITLTLANCGKKLEIDDLTKSEWTEKNNKKAKYKIKFKNDGTFLLTIFSSDCGNAEVEGEWNKDKIEELNLENNIQFGSEYKLKKAINYEIMENSDWYVIELNYKKFNGKENTEFIQSDGLKAWCNYDPFGAGWRYINSLNGHMPNNIIVRYDNSEKKLESVYLLELFKMSQTIQQSLNNPSEYKWKYWILKQN